MPTAKLLALRWASELRVKVEEVVVKSWRRKGKTRGRVGGGDNRPALARPRSTARGKFTCRPSIKRFKGPSGVY